MTNEEKNILVEQYIRDKAAQYSDLFTNEDVLMAINMFKNDTDDLETIKVKIDGKLIEEVNIRKKPHEVNQKVHELLRNYFDDLALKGEYIDEVNMETQYLNSIGINITDVLDQYNPNKGMYKLQTKLNQEQTIELAQNFFKQINPEFYEYFVNDITNNKDSISFGNDPYASVNHNGKKEKIVLTNFGDLRDLYTVVHEYAHLLDSTKGLNETREILTETNAQCMERCLDSYLKNLKNEDLSKYGISKLQLENDINQRNVATFFTRLNSVSRIEPNNAVNTKNSAYMLSQIYSTKFSKLTFEQQKNIINNLIISTRENNFGNVINSLPCDISKNNKDRKLVIRESLNDITSIYLKTVNHNNTNQQSNNNIKGFDQRSQSEIQVAEQIREKNKIIFNQKQMQKQEIKQKTLVKTNPNSAINNKGFTDAFILSLIVSFAAGVIFTIVYFIVR